MIRIQRKPGVPRLAGISIWVMFVVMVTMLTWMTIVVRSGRTFTGTEQLVVIGITLTFFVVYAVTFNVVERATRPYLPEE